MKSQVLSFSKSLLVLGAAIYGLAYPLPAQSSMGTRFHFRCEPDASQDFSFSAEGDAELALPQDSSHSGASGLASAQVKLSSLSLTTLPLSSGRIQAVVESSLTGDILHLQLVLGQNQPGRAELDFQIALKGSTESAVDVTSRSRTQKLHARCAAQPVCDWVANQERAAANKIQILESRMSNLPKYVAEQLRARLDAVAGSSSPSELNREMDHQRQVLSHFDMTVEAEKKAVASSLTSERSLFGEFEKETRSYECRKAAIGEVVASASGSRVP